MYFDEISMVDCKLPDLIIVKFYDLVNRLGTGRKAFL